MFRYLCSIFDPLRFRDRKRPAIAWLTHFYDPQAQIAFGRLAKEAAGCGQVYQFRDGLEVREGESRRQILSLSEDEIAAASPYRYAQWKDKLEAGEHVGGHVDIVIMAIAKRLSAQLAVGGVGRDQLLELR